MLLGWSSLTVTTRPPQVVAISAADAAGSPRRKVLTINGRPAINDGGRGPKAFDAVAVATGGGAAGGSAQRAAGSGGTTPSSPGAPPHSRGGLPVRSQSSSGGGFTPSAHRRGGQTAGASVGRTPSRGDDGGRWRAMAPAKAGEMVGGEAVAGEAIAGEAAAGVTAAALEVATRPEWIEPEIGPAGAPHHAELQVQPPARCVTVT